MYKKGFSVIIIVLVFLLTSGCIEEKNVDVEKQNDPKVVNWNAQEMVNDLDFSMKLSGGTMSWNMDFKSLEEGDTLILEDIIHNITYMPFIYNATQLSFNVEEYNTMGTNSSEVTFMFEGDIRAEYAIGDIVRITVTIQKYNVGNETTPTIIEIEGYNEGTSPGNDFLSLAQILPKTCIEKTS